jgi:hypothetical protein
MKGICYDRLLNYLKLSICAKIICFTDEKIEAHQVAKNVLFRVCHTDLSILEGRCKGGLLC